MPRGIPKDGTWRGREPLDQWVVRMQAEAPPCECGCGEPIRIRSSHRCHGIPRFIHGHQARALRNKYVGVDVWVEDNQGRHLCACGCRGTIEIKPYHHATGIPRYLPNHSPRPILGHGPEHPRFIRDRTAVKYRNGRGFTPWTMKIIRERDGGRCRRCGSTRDLEYDHIVPIARGGGASPDNGQLLCHDCHRLKNALDRAITQCLSATLQLAEALVAYLTAIAKEEEDGHHRHAA